MAKETKQNEKDPVTHDDVEGIMQGLAQIGQLDIEDYDTNFAIEKNLIILSATAKSMTKFNKALVKKYVVHKDGSPQATVYPNGSFVYQFKSPAEREKFDREKEKIGEKFIPDTLLKIKRSVLKTIKGLKPVWTASIYQIIEEDIS